MRGAQRHRDGFPAYESAPGAEIGFDVNSQKSGHLTLGAVTTEQGYDPFGEVDSDRSEYAGSPLYERTFERDALGRITALTETIGGQSHTYAYQYDEAGRLTAFTTDGTTTATWGYDENGNRTQVQGQAIASYDDQDRLSSYQGANARPVPSGEIEYLIDGHNRRIGKKLDGELVQGFVYRDQPNPIAELDGAGRLRSLFVYAGKGNVPLI